MKLNPGHASSHLLLAYTKQDQKLRVQSQLAFYNFLLLDPASERAATAFQEMQRMQKEGLSKGDNNAITISVSADKLANNSFSAADLMLSMMQVSNEMESHEGKTPEELFYSNTTSFFNVLGELRKKQRDFWWSYYVAFFDDMNTQGHTEAFCYYIGQSEAAKQWVIQHPEKIMALGNWYKAFKR